MNEEEKQRRFKEKLAMQLRFLERSGESYDAGCFEEAIRMAVQIRIIVHTGGKRNRSLLQHMNKGRVPLLTTSEGAPDRADLIEFVGLGTGFSSSDMKPGDPVYRAGLDNALYRDFIKADLWWKQVVLVLNRQRYSRKDIVLGTAEMEGGAHVSSELTAEFENLMELGGWQEVNSGVGREASPKPITDAHFICVRQMAHELVSSPKLRELAES